ncbi:hypothetical protein B5C00_07455 [Staphylococcus delphini]|nr:hypothetical protein B5C00_07455 [Staphylococcus delphini]
MEGGGADKIEWTLWARVLRALPQLNSALLRCTFERCRIGFWEQYRNLMCNKDFVVLPPQG